MPKFPGIVLIYEVEDEYIKAEQTYYRNEGLEPPTEDEIARQYMVGETEDMDFNVSDSIKVFNPLQYQRIMAIINENQST